MNYLSFIVGFVVFCALLAIIGWVSFYVILPLMLVGVLLSAVGTLLKKVTSEKTQRSSHIKQKTQQNQVIDVEFEEIKD